MMNGTPDIITLVPINRIEILNYRDRNMKVFEELVENIRAIGLKNPIAVAERPGDVGYPRYVLVFAEGRLNAFRILGETHVPALVVDVTDEEALIMCLAENIARSGYRLLKILADIEVQRGTIPLTTTLEIARVNENATEGDGQANLGELLQEAYENGQLKGLQIIEAKRLIEKRMEHGPASPNRDQIKPPTSSYSLVRTYQRKMVLKAEHAYQRLLLVVQASKNCSLTSTL